MEFEASTRLQDTSVAFGYQLELPKGNLLFRGTVGGGGAPQKNIKGGGTPKIWGGLGGDALEMWERLEGGKEVEGVRAPPPQKKIIRGAPPQKKIRDPKK